MWFRLEPITIDTLRVELAKRGGVLKVGAHRGSRNKESCEVCARELIAWLRHREIRDDYQSSEIPDVRRINDSGYWSSDEARTDAMLPMLAALAPWPTWSLDQQLDFTRAVTLRTIREIVASVFRAVGLTEHADALAAADTLEKARDAARDARAALDALDALDALVARAARDARAARAARAAIAALAGHDALAALAALGGEQVLKDTCRIWTEEAVRVGQQTT